MSLGAGISESLYNVASIDFDASSVIDSLQRLLLTQKFCDGGALDRAKRMAAESGHRFDKTLVQLGLITERDLAAAYSTLLCLPLIGADAFPADPVLPERLRARFLRRTRCLPIALGPQTLHLAMADPLDFFVRDAVAAATEQVVTVGIVVPIDLEQALARLYPEEEQEKNNGSLIEREIITVDDAERLRDLASEVPIVRIVNQLISRAVETQASDIHLEPFEDRLRLRYRYDGVLHDAEPPSGEMAAGIVSRIKIMAHLDIAERRLPQDGRLRIPIRGQDVDFRVSTVPSLFGETVVLRVLDHTAIAFEFDRLGLGDALKRDLGPLLSSPNGMILVTGPTGSGKTTTLYTALAGLDSQARKIVTIEDPIEYQLRGINQIQVKPQIGLSFAALLRSILRQDPDVIMVGEIRDLETAQIAAQASLTGHLVLSTLHTNSAAASITRLRDMGLEDYLIAAVVKGVVAQRLVRRLCTACAESRPLPGELVERFWQEPDDRQNIIMASHPVGCTLCRGTGYRGRFAIAELMITGPALERLILSRADAASIEAAAKTTGMRGLLQAGLDAVLRGDTSLEEIISAVGGTA